jgi:hypothetical protein
MKRISLLTPIFLIACGGSGFSVAPSDETMLQDDAGTPITTGTPNPAPTSTTSEVSPLPMVSAEVGTPEAATSDPPKAEASSPDPATTVPEAAAPIVEAAAPVIEAATPIVEAAAPTVEASNPLPMVSFTGPCINDLSGVGNANFQLVVTFTMASEPPTGGTALLNQRKTCAGGNFWDLGMNVASNGTFTVGIQTDDTSGHYTNLESTSPVVSGGLHTITVTRINGTMSLTTDTVSTVSATAMASFGSLPALAERTSVCIGVDGTKPLMGTIDSVCIQDK